MAWRWTRLPPNASARPDRPDRGTPIIRLTVLYNLPEGADEEQFIQWRLTEHQQANQSMPGVTQTDFARVTQIWPDGALPEYRFQTIVEWPDRESFELGFYNDKVQGELKENLKKLGEYSFLVSEVMG